MDRQPPHLAASVLWATLRAARPVFAPGRLPLPVKRRLVDAFTGICSMPTGTMRSTGRVAGVRVERLLPAVLPPRGVLLYLHGGGYVLGSASAYRGVAARLAAAAGADAVVADYRLAPEHPYPAALDDAVAVAAALLDEIGSPDRLLIAGDSAGGGLTLATLMALRDRGLPQPAAAGLICPWLDLAADLRGTRQPAADPLLTPAMTSEWARMLAGDADPQLPGISPIHGELGGLAPLVVHSAGDDPLAVDAARLEARFRTEVGAHAIDHQVHPRRWHDFHLQARVLADADRAIAAIGAGLGAHLPADGDPAVRRRRRAAAPAHRA